MNTKHAKIAVMVFTRMTGCWAPICVGHTKVVWKMVRVVFRLSGYQVDLVTAVVVVTSWMVVTHVGANVGTKVRLATTTQHVNSVVGIIERMNNPVNLNVPIRIPGLLVPQLLIRPPVRARKYVRVVVLSLSAQNARM